MQTISNTIITLVLLLHVYFMFLEMFLWTKPKGLKIFGQSLEQAKASATLAANQGLYNGFLAAGLLWGLLESGAQSLHIKVFFLSCIVVAGVYGSLTVSRKILYVQAAPATLGLILLFLNQ